MDGKDEHPNRWDILRDSMRDASGNTPRGPRNLFARSRNRRNDRNDRSEPQGNPFLNVPNSAPFSGAEQPTALSNASNASPFVQPPSQPSAFGQPNSFGQSTAPTQPSGFGQPMISGQDSAFGQPSMPGQPNAFGQPSMPGQPSSFGQPNAFGQNPQQQSALFGQQQEQAQHNGFIPAPFGQSPAPIQQNGFGQPSTPVNSFSQPPGASNSCGAPQQPNNFFGQPQQQQPQHSQPNPFSVPPAATKGAFAKPPAPQQNGFNAHSQQVNGSSFPQPSSSAPPVRAPGAPPFFNSTPAYNADAEAPPEDYGPEGSERRKALEEAYRQAKASGTFQGEVPEVPPLQAWTDFNF